MSDPAQAQASYLSEESKKTTVVAYAPAILEDYSVDSTIVLHGPKLANRRVKGMPDKCNHLLKLWPTTLKTLKKHVASLRSVMTYIQVTHHWSGKSVSRPREEEAMFWRSSDFRLVLSEKD
ncbi:hypothetical protein HYC85_025703 [Camellia sinensis]|uniref:Uncharacterized protein n=1 Tax=Camellia sinensis TaxID=4442 RepID=A0A7J7GCC8_CAMSI|nr:hypothetical protein HYC85_025703 [Camellia sinensis]